MARKTQFKRIPGYGTWRAMRRRCHSPGHKDYARWGAKGIVVCGAWRESFAAFLADMGPQPSPRHTLDRWPNNDGNYEPGNCRWALPAEQSRNRRDNVNLTFRGETKTAAEWARELGIGKTTICYRLANGWSVDETLSLPPGATRKGSARRRNDWSRGARNPKAKLSAEQAAQIRRSTTSVASLAKAFGVSVDAIRDIRRGKTWKTIQQEQHQCCTS